MNPKNHNYNKQGFTLIELLVVIAIVGLLSVIAVASFQNSQAKARDAQRKHDVERIRTAINLFYDASGSYPGESACNPDASNAASDCAQTSDWWNAAGNGLSNNYNGHNISEFINLPVDPINNSDYFYYYEPSCELNGTKQGYWFRYRLEDGGYIYITEGIQAGDPDCATKCDNCW